MSIKTSKNIYLSLLIVTLLLPATSFAASCNNSNWDGANRVGNRAVDAYNQANDYYNEANSSCNNPPSLYYYPSQEFVAEEYSDLKADLRQMNQAVHHYSKTGDLSGKAADKWYSLYNSCDGNSSDTAYKAYKQFIDDEERASEMLMKSRKCASHLGKLKEIMLEVTPSLGD